MTATRTVRIVLSRSHSSSRSASRACLPTTKVTSRAHSNRTIRSFEIEEKMERRFIDDWRLFDCRKRSCEGRGTREYCEAGSRRWRDSSKFKTPLARIVVDDGEQGIVLSAKIQAEFTSYEPRAPRIPRLVPVFDPSLPLSPLSTRLLKFVCLVIDCTVVPMYP